MSHLNVSVVAVEHAWRDSFACIRCSNKQSFLRRHDSGCQAHVPGWVTGHNTHGLAQAGHASSQREIPNPTDLVDLMLLTASSLIPHILIQQTL